MTMARSQAVGQSAGRLAAGRVAGGLISLIRHIYCWQWRRSAIEKLSALDDRTLKDIGLYRSMIPFVVHEACSRGGWHHGGC